MLLELANRAFIMPTQCYFLPFFFLNFSKGCNESFLVSLPVSRFLMRISELRDSDYLFRKDKWKNRPRLRCLTLTHICFLVVSLVKIEWWQKNPSQCWAEVAQSWQGIPQISSGVNQDLFSYWARWWSNVPPKEAPLLGTILKFCPLHLHSFPVS